MIEVSCHCRQIRFQVPTTPSDLGMCNCSICSKTGVLWAYYDPAHVVMNLTPEHIHSYVWGDHMIRFCRCANCGCLTHWEDITGDGTNRMGVNARMMEDLEIDRIPIRRIDGASF